MNYSKALRIVRAAKGISQQELAKRTGVSKSLLSKIEAGSRALSEEKKGKIVSALEIPPNLFDVLASESKDTGITSTELRDLGIALLKIKDEIDKLK